MKKLLIAFGIMLAALSAIPLSNYLLPSPQQSLNEITDPAFKQAATVLVGKCIDCHSSTQKLPFYANFPIAKKIIANDVSQGIARLNLDGKFKDNGAHFSELDLARLEGVTYNNSMAPFRYRMLHWNSGFSDREKAAVKNWIYEARARRRQALGITGPHAGEPFAPLPNSVSLSPEKIALGNQLFHDKRLSGDETLSCASCHSLKKGGTDQAVSSTGIRGQIGPINAPTVFNAVFNHRQFWDGRAANLEEQAGGPVTNPMEMGGEWNVVLARLRSDPDMLTRFSKLYVDGLNKENILNAIATFESSLVTPNSKFDNYLRGEKHALNAQELRGYDIFKANCASCHAGQNMGGLSFEKLGVKKDYFATRGRKPNVADMGLFNFSKNADDKFHFKVATLRNIAVTHPYFHDGSAKTLEEAVEIMSSHQAGISFAKNELADVASFLRTLTGEYEGVKLDQKID